METPTVKRGRSFCFVLSVFDHRRSQHWELACASFYPSMTAKQFQYEIQSYQEDCISKIISLFENLRQSNPFTDVFVEHHKANKYNFPIQRTKNIDVMMETGTGKTFTFIKTIFELNKNFG